MSSDKWFKRFRFFSKYLKNEKYTYQVDLEGLNFFTTSQLSLAIKNCDAGIWITSQHIVLTILVEEGNAEPIPDGFIVPSEVAIQLDSNTKELLGLPDLWDGLIKADIKGQTSRSTFSVNLSVETSSGKLTSAYKIEGPILELTPNQQFILTPSHYLIFSASAKHAKSDKQEYDNLKFILDLQKAQKLGANVKLGHFEKLDIKAPKSITIEAELDSEGNLILSPFMGQNTNHEQVSKSLGQLLHEHATALRVGEEIILFDENTMEAVREIIYNRIVPKKRVKQFIKTPTSFIKASLVNLDVGFSLRVRGATRFKHAYFGETDESGINWFGSQSEGSDIYPISKLAATIDNKFTLDEFKSKYNDCLETGADELDFQNKTYDISDKAAVDNVITSIRNKLSNGDNLPINDEGVEKSSEDISNDIAVVDVSLNDEQLYLSSPTIEKAIADVLYPQKMLNWSNYSRTPYPHQYIGIRWILGLVTNYDYGKMPKGALLADDMGIGKTLMALSAIDQLYKIQEKLGETKKPALIVAPLSLLENWKDELGKTFSSSPFNNVVILQSDSDLKTFRVGGIEIRNQVIHDKNTLEDKDIKYSLKVGKVFGSERLDLPERLVITTYQTLRDYQFSLCSIDWGVVVFDEAQNIKNPNSLQTRAAKGLNADFKLVTTGTPVENSLADFWCLMDTAYPCYLDSYQSFRKNYISPIIQCAGDEIEETRERIGRELRLKVGCLMLRRLKEGNLEGLPEKRIFVGIKDDSWRYMEKLRSEMSGHQLDIYESTISAQNEDDPKHIFSALHRLRDVSLHPKLVDRGQLDVPGKQSEIKKIINESAKMDSLVDTLQDIKERDEKCIIFCVNKRLQAFLSQALGKWFDLGPLAVINGDAKTVAKRKSTPTRKSMISDFESRKGFNIIIMSPIAVGVGLTVVGANNVIHFDRHWNPAKEDQATDRVHRIGQTKDVNIYIPLLHHPKLESFDVNLHKLLSKKRLLKDAIVTPEEVIPHPEGFSNDIMQLTDRILARNLSKLSWQQFEALCAEVMSKQLKVDNCWLTQSVSDFGADAVVTFSNSGCLIQCKHTLNSRYDGYKAIQDIYSAKPKYESEIKKSFDQLIFMTNAKTLSKRTKNIADQYQVEIVTFKKFEEMLITHSITLGQIINRLGKKRLHVG